MRTHVDTTDESLPASPTWSTKKLRHSKPLFCQKNTPEILTNGTCFFEFMAGFFVAAIRMEAGYRGGFDLVLLLASRPLNNDLYLGHCPPEALT